jgi:hypothetical protein
VKVNRQAIREAVAAAGLPSKPAKYRNVPFEVAGVRWDSKKEYARWLVLVRLREQGLIRGLRRQHRFPIKVNGELICTYVADMTYFKGGEFVVEDSKSEVTRKLPVYRLKWKLMKAVWGIEIREV